MDAAARIATVNWTGKSRNSRAGAGRDVMPLENGEPLFSRHCDNEAIARYLAEADKKDLLRTGWAEETHKAVEAANGG